MNKIDINNPKMGEIRFDVGITNAPMRALVIGSSIGKKYLDGKVVEGEVSKINLNVVSYDIAKIVQDNGGSIGDLAKISVEYISKTKNMNDINIESLIGNVIDLSKAEAGLKWISRGSSGGWNGIKIIIEDLIILNKKSNNS